MWAIQEQETNFHLFLYKFALVQVFILLFPLSFHVPFFKFFFIFQFLSSMQHCASLLLSCKRTATTLLDTWIVSSISCATGFVFRKYSCCLSLIGYFFVCCPLSPIFPSTYCAMSVD